MAYTIYLNGALVTFGIADISNELQEETFIIKMRQRYKTEDSDIVEIYFD